MTFSIKVAGAAFTNYVAEAIPSYDTLDLFQLLGTSEAASLLNYAGTKASATVVGAPSYSAGYASLSNANGFEAPMAVGKSPFTHIAVVTLASASSVGYCGNWGGGGSANMLYRNSGNLSLSVDGSPRASVAMSGTGFHFIAGTHDGSTAIVYRGAAGALTKASAAYSGGAVTTSKFRVGGNGSGTGTFDAAAVMTADAVLAEANILAIYGYLTRLLADRGVTVN